MIRRKQEFSRRQFLKDSAIATAALSAGLGTKPAYAGKGKGRVGKKVIVIGIDGMDPDILADVMEADDWARDCAREWIASTCGGAA